ncbi:hypothetical protein IKE67_03910 [bacterium]|nr:hypothetical protein [bacterium]
MSINAIKSQMLGVKQAKSNIKNDVKDEENKKAEIAQPNPTHNKQILADDVFKFMSATTTPMPVTMKRAVNVKAFVNAESEARISSMMKNFEQEFATKFSAVKSEFGNISDELAEKITLSMF